MVSFLFPELLSAEMDVSELPIQCVVTCAMGFTFLHQPFVV